MLGQENFIEKRIAILSGSTVGELQNILELFLLKQGIKPTFYQGSYNRYFEDAVYDNLELSDFNPDLIYIHTSVKSIIDFPVPFEEVEGIGVKLNNVLNSFIKVWESIAHKYNCPIIQNNFEALPQRIFGNADVYREDGALHFVNTLNQKFYEYSRANSNLYINDLNYQAAWYGLEKWFDNAAWYMYKYSFNMNAIPLVSHNIANIIKSIFGKNKKALAIDLDNTLWGGVIGDDGLDGIELGVETPKGMAYTDIQKYLKSVSKLGIALNICSKNEEIIAKTGFNHESSILKWDDFVVTKANWNNKDLNVNEIAKELNIFTDTIVFLDDNPAEREIVKNNLPSVAIPNLSEEYDFVKVLDQSGYFEVTNITEEDKKRISYFKSNQLRQHEVLALENYDDYLKSLGMKCEIQHFNNENLSRIVQLINKTNQFNLTTKRYTSEEVIQFMELTNSFGRCFKLKDKFGDNGIVSVLMADIQGYVLNINLWVMSCRVFKRELEKTIFDEIVGWCKQNHILKIRGYYYPTAKNKIVENLYSELGMSCIEDTPIQKVWNYEVNQEYNKKNEVMEVTSND